ncbi:hypothetical protein SAMN04244553_4676 [Nocardia amikacinitolerans]|uniref:Uncharacterized protein n=1 Tax=Nocardia amikacinitolerans TaxID=756689 RepID=A0A285LVP3_9NOCA|nr:hypothetical protein [Nocardia amikacinitolerans]SNY87726.1 hypothetical protein SAMN04244553_4676 [Nocardia amikacinitolerans]
MRRSVAFRLRDVPDFGSGRVMKSASAASGCHACKRSAAREFIAAPNSWLRGVDRCALFSAAPW